MNIRTFGPILCGCIALAGCGQGGVDAPSVVAGAWGADCATPFVKFEGSKMTVFPDNATYTLKSASYENNQLTVSYTSGQGEVSEVYVMEGATLRLDHGSYGGTEATWEKAPMNKCN